MNITFSTAPPEQESLFALFQTTGWNTAYRLTSQELYAAVKHSWFIMSAYETDQLIGLGRILSDGVVHALLLDLIVLPEYQNQGIGTKILDNLVTKCQKHRIRDIQLFCAHNKLDFYTKRGFRARPDSAPGMEFQGRH